MMDGTSLPIKRGIAGDLRRWRILESLQPDFSKAVSMCCVFGKSGTEALLVTHEDKVFAFGQNAEGCLGTGNTSAYSSPVEVTALSGKKVRTFAHGKKHVLALTAEGKVYGWGDNEFFQVGKAEPEKIYTPTLVFDSAPVVEIASGNYHSALRTEDGQVGCWGSNSHGQLGMGKRQKGPEPRRVQGFSPKLKCTGISCLDVSTVAVFDNGEVYAWGWNGYWHFGAKWTVRNQVVPEKIRILDFAFPPVFIKKVACGTSHILALADDGSLYFWGRKNRHQLGWQPKDKERIPISHPALTRGRITEMIAFGGTSAVMTDNSEILMWDYAENPKVVPGADSVLDVFATSSSVKITPVPLIVKSPPRDSSMTGSLARDSSAWKSNFLNCIAEQFDDPGFSDVKFVVGGETIHAHKTLLRIQSEYFRTMFAGPWANMGSEPIVVTEFNYPAYKAFLRYCYTGEVDLPMTETLELLNLAIACSESVLKTICERRIESMTTTEN